MAYPPSQSITVRDGGTGQVSSAVALPLVYAVTSGGVADTLYQYSDPNALRDVQGEGPAVELALAVIQAAGGVLLMKTQNSTAGANGSVTKVAVDSSTGTITLSGAPRDNYRALIEITVTGALGAGKFKYSLTRKDDNISAYEFSPEITIPSGGTYALGDTGITLTFVAGGGPVIFEVGDQHRFDSTAPHYTSADLTAATTALLTQIGSRKIRQVYFAGKNVDGAGAATIAASVSTQLTTLESNDYYARAMMDGGDDTASAVQTALASFTDSRVAVYFGDSDQTTLNPAPGWGTPRLPAMNAAAERAAAANLSENLGRKASGALRGVVKITHDEGTNTQFAESDKICTLRTYRGEPGFYVTNGFLKSPLGSDFKFWEWGRVADEICDTVFEGQKAFTLASLEAKSDGSGSLTPSSAKIIEGAVNGQLKARLRDPYNAEGTKGHVSALSYSVDQTNDFLATQTIQSTASAVPRPPITGFTTTIGFARTV